MSREKGTQKKVIIYIDIIYHIGGIETWLKNFYKESAVREQHSLEIWTSDIHDQQLGHFKELGIDIRILGGNDFPVCDVLVVNIHHSGKIFKFRTRKIIYTVHADYSSDYFSVYCRRYLPILIRGLAFHNRPVTTPDVKLVACSEPAASAIREHKACEAIPNYLDTSLKPMPSHDHSGRIKVGVFTRLTQEKGLPNIKMFAEKCLGLPINIALYTNKPPAPGTLPKNCVIKSPIVPATPAMAEYDWTLHLSYSESFCYSAWESLQVGTPIIINDSWNIKAFWNTDDRLDWNQEWTYSDYNKLLKSNRTEISKLVAKNNKIADKKWLELIGGA